MTSDISRIPVKPFLIETDENGDTRLTVRTTHYNSMNYPIVRSEVVDVVFPSAAAAKAHAKQHYGAEAGQFVTERAA